MGLIGVITILTMVIVGILAQRVVIVADRSAAATLAESELPAERSAGFEEALGAPFMRVIPDYFKRLKRDLYWAAFVDKSWAGKTPAAVVGRQVMFALGIGIAAYLVGGSTLWLIAGMYIGWSLLGNDLRAKSEAVQRRIEVELPETLQLMAAESASGASLDAVVQRVSEGEGYVAAWLRYALKRAHGIGLFGQSATGEGMLRRLAEESGHPRLIDFAIQMGFATGGVQVQDLLRKLSRDISERYRANADMRSEQLANKLVLMSSVFYVIPFLITILVIVGVPALSAF